MMQAWPVSTLLVGQSLYAAAAIIRFARFYICLGRARPPFVAGLAAVHCLGMVAGYFLGVLWYELSILFFFAFFIRGGFAAAFISLLLLRGLDASLLLLLSLCFGTHGDMRLMIFFLGVLLLSIVFFFFSLEPIIRRTEKKILELSRPVVWDINILRCLHSIRVQFALLSWRKPGSLSLLIALTLGAWFTEWLAFFCLMPTAEQALADMLRRVMGTFHFFIERGATALGVLQPGVWGLGMICVVILLARLARKKFITGGRRA